jgi:N utilization substance protein A
MEVIVEDKQLSLAIGKKGQNVRLAAKLTGWKIDIKSEEEKRREVEAQFEGLELGSAEPDAAEPASAEAASDEAAADEAPAAEAQAEAQAAQDEGGTETAAAETDATEQDTALPPGTEPAPEQARKAANAE